MINIRILPPTIVLIMQLPSRLTVKISYHNNFLKYQNIMFNLRSVTKIHFIYYLVVYLLTSLNRNFWQPLSILICKLVPLSKIIANHILLQLMCIAMVKILRLVLSIMTHQPFIMVLHLPIYFLAQSHWFQMYMAWKIISSLSIPWSKISMHGEQLVNL